MQVGDEDYRALQSFKTQESLSDDMLLVLWVIDADKLTPANKTLGLVSNRKARGTLKVAPKAALAPTKSR